MARSCRGRRSASIAEPDTVAATGERSILQPFDPGRRGVAFACAVIGLCALAACREEAPPQRPLTLVKVATATASDFAPHIALTGAVMARDQSDLSFRIGGKVVERTVDVGDHVTAGQVLARLDPQEQQADVEAAQAGIESAEAQLKQASASFERQKTLLTTGVTTRREFDQIESAFRSAQAQLDTARAQRAAAQVNLDHTILRANADGVIVARLVEAGQVVAQAQAGFTLARDGPRDAVFNVHEWVLANVDPGAAVEITLVSDPAVRTTGSVRDVAPAIDASTATVAVKVALTDPPAKMTLGALVSGTGQLRRHRVVLLPWSALFELDGKPAVWLLDPAAKTVSLKPIVLDRFTRDSVAVASGIAPGDSVVTAGVQSLRPGQQVAIAP